MKPMESQYSIVGIEGDGDELIASLRLGDNQHRRALNLFVRPQHGGNNEKRSFYVNGVSREDGSGQSFCFDGYDISTAPWTEVQGWMRTDSRHGNVSPKPKVNCLRCKTQLRNIHDDYCSRCGAAQQAPAVRREIVNYLRRQVISLSRRQFTMAALHNAADGVETVTDYESAAQIFQSLLGFCSEITEDERARLTLWLGFLRSDHRH